MREEWLTMCDNVFIHTCSIYECLSFIFDCFLMRLNSLPSIRYGHEFFHRRHDQSFCINNYCPDVLLNIASRLNFAICCVVERLLSLFSKLELDFRQLCSKYPIYPQDIFNGIETFSRVKISC